MPSVCGSALLLAVLLVYIHGETMTVRSGVVLCVLVPVCKPLSVLPDLSVLWAKSCKNCLEDH